MDKYSEDRVRSASDKSRGPTPTAKEDLSDKTTIQGIPNEETTFK